MECKSCLSDLNDCTLCDNKLEICILCGWFNNQHRYALHIENMTKCLQCTQNMCSQCGNDIANCGKCNIKSCYICSKCKYSTITNKQLHHINDEYMYKCIICADGVSVYSKIKTTERCRNCGILLTNAFCVCCQSDKGMKCANCTDVFAMNYCYQCL
jgi:hypothetical protein